MIDYEATIRDLTKPNEKGELSVREVVKNAFVCKDYIGNISLAILHNSDGITEWPKPRKTAALYFSSGDEIQLTVDGQNYFINGPISIITCTDQEVSTPFFIMISAALSSENLIRNMVKNPNIMWDFLQEFYQCFSKSRQTNLSRNEAIGLWGELSKILDGELTSSIIESWKGPEKYIHDFICDDIAIDVKTTTGKSRIHKIKHDQIYYGSSTKLFIQSFVIRKNHTGGKSVDELVEKISNTLNPKSCLDFINKMGLIGYNHKGEHIECGIKYSERLENKLFSAEKIPHIERKHIPDGILSMEYSITLDNLASITREKSLAIDRHFRSD
jgi:hypothetical protein